jgi:hypothetical protein
MSDVRTMLMQALLLLLFSLLSHAVPSLVFRIGLVLSDIDNPHCPGKYKDAK